MKTRQQIAAKSESVDVVTFGAEVKALPGGKVGGYLVRYTDATNPDLTGDYFDAKSDIRVGDSLDVYYNHGLDKELKKRVIGRAMVRKDAAGVWAETQLNLRDEYEKAIYEMAQKGKLGYSSGAISHLVEREPAGKGVMHIKTWVIGEASLTPTPAEPRNSVMSVKSLEQSSEGTALPTEDAHEQPEPVIEHKETIMNDEIKSAIEAAFAERDAAAKAEADKAATVKAAEEAGYKKAVEELTAKKMLKTAPAYVKHLGSDSDDGVSAFKSWLATGEKNSELIEPDSVMQSIKGAGAAWNVTTGASGSYLVPDPLYQQIIAKRDIASWARQAPVQWFSTPADHLLVPVEDTKHTTFVKTDEAAAYDENEGTVAQKDLVLYKYTKAVKMSEEFVNYQGTNFDQWLINALSRAEALTENSIFTAGDGTGDPQGVLVGATSSSITSASATAVTPDELAALVGKLGGGYNVPGQVGFLMQNATKWALKGTQTSGFFAFIATPSGNDFLGMPAYVSDDMEALAATKKAVLFGNFNLYGAIEKPGMLVQRNPYLYMANGQIGIFASIFRGGAVLQAEAFYYMTQHA